MFQSPIMTSKYDYIQKPIQNPYLNIQPDPDPALQKYQDKSKGKQFKISVISTFLFLLLSNPITYRITNQLYQIITNRMYQVIGEDGSPTFKGIVIHAAIFFAISIFVVF